MRIVSLASFFLMIVGALNWLLVGLVRFDLVQWLFGRNSLLRRLVYGLVGIAGITQLTNFVVHTGHGEMYPTAS